MKNKAWILIFLFMLSYYANSDELNLEEFNKEIEVFTNINFDNSMNFGLKSYFLQKHICKDFFYRLNLFNSLYKKNNPLNVKPSAIRKIPKIIHQIWLGGKLPDKFQRIAQKWQELHKDWQHILWDDNNIKNLFPLYNQKIFDECTNFGEKSDILRYEILFRFGGIYADVDYECIKSFNILSFLYDFYAGIEPLDLSPLIIGNAVIGSAAYHPILKYCVETIKNFRKEIYITSRTGPGHLTRSVIHVCKKIKDSIIILPISVLYPLSYDEIQSKKIIDLRKESFGIHYWAGSWK